MKYPKDKIPPKVDFPTPDRFNEEAVAYTQKYFGDNYGELNVDFLYPTTFVESKKWLQDFSKHDFQRLVTMKMPSFEPNILHHSVLTPMLNTGLITPQYIIDETLLYAHNHEIPLNSLEGFIRQLLVGGNLSGLFMN